MKNAQEVFDFLQQEFKEWKERHVKKSGGKCIHFFQKALFVTDIDRTEEISAVTTKGSSNFSTLRSTGIPFVIESRNVACLCPNCLFGDTYACPNKHYSGTWTRYNLHTGKKVTDHEFFNKHWCANEDCTEGSDAQSSLQSPSVSCNIQSHPTSPSVTSTANENSDLEFCENTDVSVEQDLDTRIQMCANFGALADLFDSHEPFAPIDYTVAKICRSHRLDTDALKYKPSDAPKGYYPVQVFGNGNCSPRALAIAIGKDPEEEHWPLWKRMCWEGVQNKPCYLNNEYLSCGITNLPVRSTLPIMYAQFSEYTRNFGCVDGETRAERINRWSKIAEQVYEAEVFASHKKNEYMGVWQILQATNCIYRPICIVYPEMFTNNFRRHLNRTFFPFNETEREREPIYIMWTCTVNGGCPNHFVPLLKH